MKQKKPQKSSSTSKLKSSAPPELVRLQKAITEYVSLDPKRTAKNHPALSFLNGDPKQNTYRLGLYRRGYHEKFENFLRSIYPGTFRLLKKRDQAGLLELFRLTHPSSTYSLDDSAGHLPKFMKVQTAVTAKYPAILELTKFEWVLHLALQKKTTPRRKLIFKSEWNLVQLRGSRCHPHRYPKKLSIFLLNENGKLRLHGK